MISNTIQLSQNTPVSQEKIIKSLTKTELAIFMLLSDVSRYCSKIYMTRELIADRVGCCPTSVSRATKRLNKLGLIWKTRKRYGLIEKCTYKVIKKYLGIFKKKIQKFIDFGPKFAVRILRSESDKLKNVTVVNSLNINYLYLKDNNNNLRECISKQREECFEKSFANCHIREIGEAYLENYYYLDYNNREMNDKNLYKTNESKGKYMNRNDNILITPAIAKATEMMGLTPSGQSTLRAFPDEVIMLCLVKLASAGSVKNEPQFVIDKCIEYCKEKRMPINWTLSYKLKEAYGIPRSDIVYSKKAEQESIKGEKVTNKTNYKVSGKQYPEPKEVQEACAIAAQALKEKLKSDDERRKIAFASPMREIKIWEDRLKSESYQICKRKLGCNDALLVSPSVVEIIVNQRVEQEEIERLFNSYPFIKEICSKPNAVANQMAGIIGDVSDKIDRSKKLVESENLIEDDYDFLHSDNSDDLDPESGGQNSLPF